jgi:hypothetical protein
MESAAVRDGAPVLTETPLPTLTQVRDTIDTFVTNRWPTIVARQENFRTNRGRYWQGLFTHTLAPAWTSAADGSSLGDRLSEGPGDQFSTWLNVFPEWATELLPARVRIDVYDGPDGQGWVVTVEATHNGNLWRRVVNVGPESYRAQPWTQVVPTVP